MDQEKKKTMLIIIWCSAAAVLLAGAIALVIYLMQFKTYEDHQFKFKIQYPSEWKKSEHYAGTAVTFARPKKNAFETFSPNVNITVQEVPDQIATLSSFSETITKQMKAVFNDIQVLDDSDCRVANRPGHRLVLVTSSPNDFKMVFKWTIKGQFAYIFTFMATQKQYKELTPTIKRMVESLQID